ncbi:MAG TPA: hypothetical protein PKL98_00895 [Candidatus Pacearchaeota archaeon]|nr:hypothetical protein [Candidatus Pacearchaeota archaeon]
MQPLNFDINSFKTKVGNFFKFLLDNYFWLVIVVILFVVAIQGFYFYSINNKIKSAQDEISVKSILLNQQEFDKFKELAIKRKNAFLEDVTIDLENPFFPASGSDDIKTQNQSNSQEATKD